MTIGIDSFSYQISLAAGTYDVFRTLDSIAALGLSGVQLNINGANGRFLGGDPSDAAHLRAVRTALEERGLFAEIGGAGTGPQAVQAQLRLCAQIGAGVLRTLLVFEGSLESTLEQARRDLEQSLPLAAELGVVIALENHEDVTAGELLACLERIDDPWLGACLDTGNDLSLYGDPVESVRLLAPRAATTHIKDQKLVRLGGAIYSVGVPLGEGDVDLAAILAVIRRESRLTRILIQDTTGYSAPLNRFGRTDLERGTFGDEAPAYESAPALRSDGLLLALDDLGPEELRAHAAAKEQAIERDVARVRSWMERT